MGKSKSKKKNKKSEFDDFFEKQNKQDNDGGWVSGVSAMALDDEAGPSEKEVKESAMDTSEAKPRGSGGNGLGVQKVSMKAVRGQRTKAQKLRKVKAAEKATARADKTVVRTGVKVAIKQKKSTLKTIY